MPKALPPDEPIDVPRLTYSIQQAAIALQVSESTLAKAISNDLVRHRRMGVLIRIPTEEVERIAREGLPVVPFYKRKTAGPTTRGRPSRAVAKRKPRAKVKAKSKPRSSTRDERRVSP